ncbi:MAG: 2-succinyl-5-enolpyruvyl-6-hydroxy-3-cyclohexene-1-carboxylic-acid synthase [Thermoflavifilum sp.]|nr:2-succinyl-5-enolpyruvyl-6-hydroxy-3-cyclohexene-1-carboxylic-acid synthase [Thermoflavifilum sp.]MCL6514189.1 2-succinyl-5-enolpyruvyl-6-hydroxy-3-cyclohexene-1-carboxylic-acid synthase [Alicyclobacillus sp.]
MPTNLDLRPVLAFVGELSRAGVRDVCLSPGSRSTPLAVACARHPEMRVWTLLDERAAGFFALGLAKVRRQPVLLVCTSGTAAANYLPAVVEAAMSRVPLLLVTADRPPELHGIGSNQTIDQLKLFGTHVKAFWAMPVPQADGLLERQAAAMAWRCTAVASADPAGPVHLNWPLREPLMPPQLDAGTVAEQAGGGLQALTLGRLVLSEADLVAWRSQLQAAARPLLVVGPHHQPELAAAALALARRWGAPVLADPLAQLRAGAATSADGRQEDPAGGPPDRAGNTIDEAVVLVDAYDALLRSPKLAAHIQPDVVVHLGQPPTSKALGQWLEQQRHAVHLFVDHSPAWLDPWFAATHVCMADPAEWCQALVASWPESSWPASRQAWLTAWRTANARVQTAWAAMEQGQPLWEGGVVRALAAGLPAGSALVWGNSMPVRDADSFWPSRGLPLQAFGNRGASGIDGVVSTAAGIAAARSGQPQPPGTARSLRTGGCVPTVVVLGDVSFAHDVGGLWAAVQYGADLLVVVINNRGGGIFRMLPQAGADDVFAYFATPPGLDLAAAAAVYGARYACVTDYTSLHQALESALAQGGVWLVEVEVDPETNLACRRQWLQAAMTAGEGVQWPVGWS